MEIDLTRDKLFSNFAFQTLVDRYLLPEENFPQEALARAAKAYSDDDAHAQRVYDYASKLWFMFSTPILSNGGTGRGLPISCFLNYVDDSRAGITDTYKESAFLASIGGGVGTYYGEVRSKGSKTSKGSQSTGVIPFIKVQDSLALAFSQGVTRRGSHAVYMDIDHPEIEEFLDIRKTSGDQHRRSLNLHHGVNLTDKFMRIIDKAFKAKKAGQSYDDSWDLIDPHTKEIKKTVSAISLWIKILQNRMELGEPYCFFIDTANDALPEFQQRQGLSVKQSNLCSEITLATNKDRTAVCCLSSVNAEKYDEWKDDPLFIEDLIRFLDNVITDFCRRAPEELYRAIYSASRERSLGLGLMGFHALLQSKGLPIESAGASMLNKELFSHIKSKALEATKLLAKEKGECPDGKGSGVRNAHLLAIAPNASSSIICGNTSPGIEPFAANVYNQKTLTGTSQVQNKYLKKVLQKYGKDTEEIWSQIMAARGSVQGLDFLSDYEKDLFKTAKEIDQLTLVRLAAERSPYICQAQSLNLFLPANVNKQDLHIIHMKAWEWGLKSLYYLRSEAPRQSDNLSQQKERHQYAFEAAPDECLACEG